VTSRLAALLASTPSPSPTSTVPDASQVTPGLVGFLATFAVVVATVLLLLDMVRRIRRLRYREQQALLEQERAEREHPGPPDDDGRDPRP
jgi:hypothetical protein